VLTAAGSLFKQCARGAVGQYNNLLAADSVRVTRTVTKSVLHSARLDDDKWMLRVENFLLDDVVLMVFDAVQIPTIQTNIHHHHHHRQEEHKSQKNVS
jgi:hypothetical protein